MATAPPPTRIVEFRLSLMNALIYCCLHSCFIFVECTNFDECMHFDTHVVSLLLFVIVFNDFEYWLVGW